MTARECVECGTEFVSPHPKTVCCSAECKRQRHLRRQRDYARRKFVPSTHRASLPERQCLWCGKSFKPYTAMNVLCSVKCRGHHRQANLDRKQVARFCRTCGIVALEGRRQVCDGCKKDPRVRQRAGQHRRALRAYNLTVEQYDAMLAEQGGRCAICRSSDPGPKSWHVDHDHDCCPAGGSCGKCVRGLLCHSCNLLLGHAEGGGSPILCLQAAIGYLMAAGAGPESAWDGESLRRVA